MPHHCRLEHSGYTQVLSCSLAVRNAPHCRGFNFILSGKSSFVQEEKCRHI